MIWRLLQYASIIHYLFVMYNCLSLLRIRENWRTWRKVCNLVSLFHFNKAGISTICILIREKQIWFEFVVVKMLEVSSFTALLPFDQENRFQFYCICIDTIMPWCHLSHFPLAVTKAGRLSEEKMHKNYFTVVLSHFDSLFYRWSPSMTIFDFN